MIGSAIELITLAASNSLFILCFCNLIIVILLLGGSSKPTSDVASDSPSPVPTGACRNQNEIGGAAGDKKGSGSTEDGELCAEKATVDDDGDEEENENDKEEEEEDDDDDDEDDELRRKVEEFIDKINRGWKAEKLRTSLMV